METKSCAKGHIYSYEKKQCPFCRKEWSKMYAKENALAISEKHKRYREENKEILAQKRREYYLANKETFNKKAKDYYKRNRESTLAYVKEYTLNNKEKIASYKSEHFKLNKEKINKYKRQWEREQYKNNLYFKLKQRLRSRIAHLLNRKRKTGSAVKDLGCSIEYFKMHLETLFKNGMTWDNYGNKEGCWSLDHIKPLSRFNLENKEEFLLANHYTNIQPLWHIENMRKGNKLEGEKT